MFSDRSNESVSIVLKNVMQELEVLINFNPVTNDTTTSVTWCDNVRLFIIYGTYAELMQGNSESEIITNRFISIIFAIEDITVSN